MSEILKDTVTRYRVNNCLIVGEVDLFSSCKGFLSLNWEGNVDKVFHEIPKDLSWYECIDKGGIPLYGFNDNGNIVCSVALIKREQQDHYGKKHNEDVISVAPANQTDSWGWGLYKNFK